MRKRDENKEQILKEKALKMFVEKGFDGISMQKLAKEAGVSPATIYIYYKDRDDLIIQLCVEENNKMVEATLKNFSSEMHFEEGLRIQWLNRAKYCMENAFSMHFMEQVRFSPYYTAAVKAMDKTFSQIMGEFVHNAIRRNELIKLPIEVYWSVAFAPLYQLVKFHMSGKGIGGKADFVLDQKTMDQTLELVLKALKP